MLYLHLITQSGTEYLFTPWPTLRHADLSIINSRTKSIETAHEELL